MDATCVGKYGNAQTRLSRSYLRAAPRKTKSRDFDRRRVHRGTLEVRLTQKEFELLTLLVTHAGRVLTHRTILKAIWGSHAVDQPEHLRVLMGQLRKKIEPDSVHPRYLLTEPEVGYRFAEPD